MPKGEHNDAELGRRAARIRWARERGQEVPASKKGCPESRVRSRYGKASKYRCSHCPARALDWSWIHGTDREDIESYMPLCRSCHMYYDRELERQAKGRRKLPAWTPETRKKQLALMAARDNSWTASRRARYEATIANRRKVQGLKFRSLKGTRLPTWTSRFLTSRNTPRAISRRTRGKFPRTTPS